MRTLGDFGSLSYLVVAVLAGLLLSDSARGSQCLPAGATPSAGQVFIDANTATPTGETYFARGSHVEVVVTDKNPYKYSYAVSIDVETVDTSGILGTLFGIVPALAPVSSLWDTTRDAAETGKIDAAAAAAAAPPLPGAPSACTGVERQILDRFGSDLKLLINEGAALRPRVAALRVSFTAARNAQAAFLTAVQPDKVDCATTSALAVSTRGTLAGFSVGDLSTKITKHKKDITGLEEIIRYFSPSPACSARHSELLLIARGLTVQAEELAGTVDQAVAGKKGFDELAKTIAAVEANGASYYETRTISAGWKPSIATVKIVRTPRTPEDAKAEPAKTREIRIGQPFFTLSVGFGPSDIKETTSAKEASQVPDGSGGQMLGERFAVTRESDPTVLGAVLLNANLWRPWPNKDRAVALSVGVSVGESDQSSDYGYLIGPSLALLDNTLYLTLGYHVRELKTLGGDFSAGDPVPAGLEEIPLREANDEGVMFVVSYKIK